MNQPNIARILIADDDEMFCYVLKERLVEKNYLVDIAYDGKQAAEMVQKSNYDVVMLDLNMPIKSGDEALVIIKERYPSLPVIILSGEDELRRAIECMKNGAADYIVKPYKFEELLVSLEKALEHRDLLIKNEVLSMRTDSVNSGKIIGESPSLKQLIFLAERAAKSDSNILIEGETGTGKELIAEFIHRNSYRSDKPFVVINCASLPDQLIESELFGFEKGSFTDAKASKQGLVEIANGGTLFLDEIGEMSLAIQPKLLRFLENGEYRRIGGLSNLSSNVRVIGATNRNLIAEAEKKLFRKDLLFRLNVVTLTIPPLRERGDDVILLAEYFLRKKSPIRSPKILSESAKNALRRYHFPGNVRELEHIIERAIIFAETNVIQETELFLPDSVKTRTEQPSQPIYTDSTNIEELEKLHIERILRLNNWEQAKTAAQLGISIKTLYNKIKKYNLKEGLEK